MTMTNPYFTIEERQPPSQPLIERVFAILVRKWQANERGWVYVSHSQLADELGCSAGNLPGIMRKLEGLGRIIRETWRNKWRRIKVVQPAESHIDQSAALIDQSDYAQLMLPMELPPEVAPAHQDAVEARSEADETPIDRFPLHVRKNLLSKEEEDSAPARASIQSTRVAQPQPQLQLDQGIYNWLMQHPRMDEPTARQIAARPAGTLADLTDDYKQAEKMKARGEINSPRWFLVWRWKYGQRVPTTPNQEEQHGTAIQQRPTPNVRRGGAAPAGGTSGRAAPAEAPTRPASSNTPANFQRTTFRAPSTNW